MLHLDEPVSFIKGVTPNVRRAWDALGIKTVEDLLLTIPRRYDDYSRIIAIHDARPEQVVTIRGKIIKCVQLHTFRKRIKLFRATIQDSTGVISATFFNQPWVMEEFKPGREVFWSGKILLKPPFGKTMVSPIWEPADREQIAVGKIAPVYPLTGALTQKRYRQMMQYVLSQLEKIHDPLSDETRAHLHLQNLRIAFSSVHNPSSIEEAEEGRRRIAFDELLSYQLALTVTKRESIASGGISISFDQTFAKRFVTELPFQLTDDQKRVTWAALQDMEKSEPMRRLLQGDVGSGKTVVAAFLAAHVVRAGYSAAFLAPTDILAHQHAETLRRFLIPHHVPVVLITRTEKPDAESLAQIEQGNLLIIGTHAILERGRIPNDLAFAIIDEQHRFGVEQREALISKVRSDGKMPHLLSMTATPIPRSLALTLYGDLQISTLREKPANRASIQTKVCVGEDREIAYQAIKEAVSRKEQAFIVCPLIDPSDALGVRSVTEEYKRLSKTTLAGLRTGLLHGRLKATEKEDLMKKLNSGELDVLVATTVIEVGIDIPRATVMATEGAERFGLAQLHQLRGRVGRSHLPSFCFLMTDSEGQSLDRLRLVEHIHDGFKLAEEDLKLRGAGNLIGKEQSGIPLFFAARMTDLELMVQAHEQAEQMINADLSLSVFPEWKKRVNKLRETNHLE